jgi:adenylate kinase family enzyme
LNSEVISAFNNTIFGYLCGPTCVAKGFLLKLLGRSLVQSEKAGLRVGVISFGQMIRDRMESDFNFRRIHSPTIEAGDLLDDSIAIELFNGKLLELAQEGPFDLMFVDGFCRSVPQVGHAADINLLRKQDRVYFIEATHDVCSKRFTHRNENAPGRLEREMKTFTKRYHLHVDNVDKLEAALRATNVRDNIIEIDANNRDAKGNPVHDCHPTMGITEYAFPALISDLWPITATILARRAIELQNLEVHDG